MRRLRLRCTSHSSWEGISCTRRQTLLSSKLLSPVRLEILIVELCQIAVHPTRRVYAVGDRSHRHFGGRQLRPQILEHLLRNFAMQHAYRVAESRRLQRQHRHRKALGRIIRILHSQSQQLLEWDPRLLHVFAEVIEHHTRVEQIDSGRHRGVRGEDIANPGRFERLLKGQPVILHQHPGPFNTQKGRVPFVHVVHGRLVAQFLQRPQAPNTQHDLLADALVMVAAVELVGDLAIFRPIGSAECSCRAHTALPARCRCARP